MAACTPSIHVFLGRPLLLLSRGIHSVISFGILSSGRSQWPRGLRRRSAAARLLRSWVRIPLGAWMFVLCECCVLSGRGLCDELITRPEESYRLCCVVVCDLEKLRNEKAMTRVGSQPHSKKKISSGILLTWPFHCSLFFSMMSMISGFPFTPISSFICLFFILSILDFLADLSTSISVDKILFVSQVAICHTSAPYTKML